MVIMVICLLTEKKSISLKRKSYIISNKFGYFEPEEVYLKELFMIFQSIMMLLINFRF